MSLFCVLTLRCMHLYFHQRSLHENRSNECCSTEGRGDEANRGARYPLMFAKFVGRNRSTNSTTGGEIKYTVGDYQELLARGIKFKQG